MVSFLNSLANFQTWASKRAQIPHYTSFLSKVPNPPNGKGWLKIGTTRNYQLEIKNPVRIPNQNQNSVGTHYSLSSEASCDRKITIILIIKSVKILPEGRTIRTHFFWEQMRNDTVIK
jgi:hypothetical protein